jgi:hypothetical protein
MAGILCFPPVAATTTTLTPAVEIRKVPREANPVRLSWVVVTDNGRRQLRMLWTPGRPRPGTAL